MFEVPSGTDLSLVEHTTTLLLILLFCNSTVDLFNSFLGMQINVALSKPQISLHLKLESPGRMQQCRHYQ